MRRKKPEIGDLVRVPVEMNSVGLVTSTMGIQLWVQPLKHTRDGLLCVRRDSVEVISRANSH